MIRISSSLALVAASLLAGCAAPSVPYQAYTADQKASLVTENVEVGEGWGGGTLPKIYGPKHEIKKLGLLAVSAPRVKKVDGDKKSIEPDPKTAEQFAGELQKALEAQGFQVVPLAEVAKAPSWKEGGDDASSGKGYAAGSRVFEGLTALKLTMGCDWMANLQRETGCDAFVVAEYKFQSPSNIFAFIPRDRKGYKAHMTVLVPYNNYKVSATDAGQHVEALSKNQHKDVVLRNPVEENVDTGALDAGGMSLVSELLARAFRVYYPKPL